MKKITNKFNINDTCWVMYRNKPLQVLVTKINLSEDEKNIYYSVRATNKEFPNSSYVDAAICVALKMI